MMLGSLRPQDWKTFPELLGCTARSWVNWVFFVQPNFGSRWLGEARAESFLTLLDLSILAPDQFI